MGIGAIFDKWGSRGSTVATFWPILPAGVVAGVTGYLSTSVAWISQFGAFGWWSAALISFVLTTFTLLAGVMTWGRIETLLAVRKWKTDVDNFNPLEKEFVKKRILLKDMRHPAHSFIVGKTFTDCEIVGPGVVLFISGSYNDIGFINCDLIRIADKQFLYAPTGFKDCNIRGSSFINCVVYVPDFMYERIKDMPGIQFVNDPTAVASAPLSPQGTGLEIRQ